MTCDLNSANTVNLQKVSSVNNRIVKAVCSASGPMVSLRALQRNLKGVLSNVLKCKLIIFYKVCHTIFLNNICIRETKYLPIKNSHLWHIGDNTVDTWMSSIHFIKQTLFNHLCAVDYL